MGTVLCWHSRTHKLRPWPMGWCSLWNKIAEKEVKWCLYLALMAILLHTFQSTLGAVLAWNRVILPHPTALPGKANHSWAHFISFLKCPRVKLSSANSRCAKKLMVLAGQLTSLVEMNFRAVLRAHAGRCCNASSPFLGGPFSKLFCRTLTGH